MFPQVNLTFTESVALTPPCASGTRTCACHVTASAGRLATPSSLEHRANLICADGNAWSGQHGDVLQAGRLGKSEHHVHALHRLAGAPFVRLSSTTSTITVSGVGRCTAMRATFDARTDRVSGADPAGRTSTKGSSR